MGRRAIEYESYDVRFEVKSSLSVGECDQLIAIEGEILELREDNKFNKIGTIQCYFIDIESALSVSHYRLLDCFDYLTDLSEYYGELWDSKNRSLKISVLKKAGIDESEYGSIFIVDVIEIDSQYTSSHIPNLAALRAIQLFGHGVSLVATHSFALLKIDEVDKKVKHSNIIEFPLETEKEAKRTRKYFSKIGFKRVGKSQVLIRGGGVTEGHINMLAGGS